MEPKQADRIESMTIVHKGVEITSQKRWTKTLIGYKCNRCSYCSERRSNVDRHFKRIHCQLEKLKICICEKKFSTKGDFYNHCAKEHPNSRLVTSRKYKMEKSSQDQEKENQGSVDKGIYEYLSLIDFEVLDAVINLKYLKESKSNS